MPTKDAFTREVRLAIILVLALCAALVFGILVLARGDWIPGTIIVVASLVGLARQVPVITALHR